MTDYLNELNEVQRKAVTNTDGPVMVIAGPGSGKTRVLTYRVAHLIEKGIEPWRILALTFTNKAAREMKERIEKVVGRRANYVWAGTFHSIFARILRVEAHHLGYPNDFTIYDTDDTKSVISNIIKDLGLDKNAYNVGGVRSRISNAKSNLITWKAYADNPELIEKDRMNRRPKVYKIYERYVKRLEKAGAMDFDDLLLVMFRLLYENPNNAREKYQAQFQYVLVDEFQDTNFLQYAIVKQLVDYKGSPNNICIVGDDAQSIYAFRGATIDNIFDFEKDFGKVQMFKLEQNYRSTEHIISAANDVITHNKKQIKKEIWTQKSGGQKIRVVRALSDTEEGRRVVDFILELKNRYHVSNNEIAILYRTNAQSRVFEEFLRRQNLKYRIYGGQSFYQRKEVKDLLGYFRLTVNPRDDEALRRIVNYPRRGIGKTTIDKLFVFADSNGISTWEAIDHIPIGSRPQKLLKDFKALVQGFQVKMKSLNAYDLGLSIYRNSGIHDVLKNDTSIEGMNRVENINALFDGMQAFTEQEELEENEQIITDKSLASYIQNIALLTDQDEESDDNDHITMMSTHAAKGLEFRAVFVVGLEENLFPSYMSMDSPESIDEERRLFYVAITRAMEFLSLSFANSRYHFGQMRFNDRSRFLDEISLGNVENTGIIQGATKVHQSPRAGVSGVFKRTASAVALSTDQVDNFKASPQSHILPGKKVLHLKFGEGEILDIDGNNDTRVATILFENIDNPKRRIMLKFAKLQVMD